MRIMLVQEEYTKVASNKGIFKDSLSVALMKQGENFVSEVLQKQEPQFS